VYKLDHRRDFPRWDDTRNTLGNNSDYQATARQLVHSRMGNGVTTIELLRANDRMSKPEARVI
jgi:hypothetical protein